MDELRQASAVLASHTPAGACDERCGCLRSPLPDEAVGPAIAIACSLGQGEIGDRLAAWRSALADVRSREPLERGLRLRLGAQTSLSTIADLIVAEQRCCPFFTFALTVDATGAALEVCAPDGAIAAVEELVGGAA